MANEKATAAFIEKIEENKEILTNLLKLMENHMNVEAEEVNWGHVGNAGHVNELLREIQEFV